jgi:hypothetical protein
MASYGGKIRAGHFEPLESIEKFEKISEGYINKYGSKKTVRNTPQSPKYIVGQCQFAGKVETL